MPATSGNDSIEGSTGPDFIDGFAGNDTIWGRSGDDAIYGGDGLDSILGEDGNDESRGDSGVPTGFGASDTISGGSGSDRIFGDDGDDLLYGDSGSDSLEGGAGNDSIYGGNSFCDPADRDTLSGGDGNDTLFANSSQRSFHRYNGGNGEDEILVTSGFLWLTTFNPVLSIEVIRAFSGAPSISIYGSNWSDNRLDFSGTTFTNVGGILADDGSSDFTGGGADTVIGTAGADQIYGEGGNDSLFGGSGDDILGGGANNALPYQTQTNDGADTIDGGDGLDTALYFQARSVMTVTGTSASFSISIGGVVDLLSNVETVRIGSASYTFTELLSGVIYGSMGAEAITGTAGNDTIDGRDGEDSIQGLTGADSLYGGEGRDVLEGGAGADLHDGGNEFDYVSYAGSALGVRADMLSPQTGTGDGLGDTFVSIDGIQGSNFNDIISGTNSGSDWLYGFAGADVFYSRSGIDYMYGGAGSDIFYFAKGYGLDTIGDFIAGAASGDLIQLQASGASGVGTAFDTFAEIFAAAVQQGADTVITFDGANRLTLSGVTKANLTAGDFMIL